MQKALNKVASVHSNLLSHYKRLLQQAQASTASQLHALQAELHVLRRSLEDEKRKARDAEMQWDRERISGSAKIRGSRHSTEANDVVYLIGALRGDGKGEFNGTAVRKAVRSLKLADRMRL